jgi:DNA-binding response OmpR family regulator
MFIIMVTVMDDLSGKMYGGKMYGIEIGADVYITKSFSPIELVA